MPVWFRRRLILEVIEEESEIEEITFPQDGLNKRGNKRFEKKQEENNTEEEDSRNKNKTVKTGNDENERVKTTKDENEKVKTNKDENKRVESTKDEGEKVKTTKDERMKAKTNKEDKYTVTDGINAVVSRRDENNKGGKSNDEIGNKESSADEKDEKDENKDKKSQDWRNKVENEKCKSAKDGGSQDSIVLVMPGISQREGIGNSQQSESSGENSIGTGFSEEEAEEEDDTTGESVLKQWRLAFCWNDFFYSIIFGLGPTAWDVISDLRFGWSMRKAGDPSSAGLCYLFTTLPGFFFLQEVIILSAFKECSSRVNTTVVVATTLVATSAMALGFLTDPLLFQYPATILGCSIVGVKVVGVFVHTPEMKAFSMRVSSFEYSTESSLQLLLLLHLWLSGGPLYLYTILSSLLVIGKCSAEEYLMGNPENLLKDKSAVGKFWLTLKYIPLFSLTAFFRVGAGVVKVGSSLPN